ncbi:gamma-glutamylcyclotransferase [Glaciecola siphonariae]|uniref:glutathione-specific gamma-glutamylcyclotransferase n=1 Tax=Glaciecola siphonariae TaxID=521012 RepID=A0ABV9M0C9_9ALTE
MTYDTQTLNSGRHKLDEFEELWVFGYGSLIYKVDFPYLDKSPAHIKGYERRMWQGSSDHRGTPSSPGRVATLTPSGNTLCFGMAYRVTPDVFEHLDHREKNGYLREEIDITLATGSTVRGLVYMATPDNEAFLGDASTEELARHIYESEGPSGENKDYVYDLAEALRKHGEHDEHIFAIEQALLEIEALK